MRMAHACAALTALVTLTLCCHLAVAQSSSPCESIPSEKVDGPAVPDFPEQYSMHVEANIIQVASSLLLPTSDRTHSHFITLTDRSDRLCVDKGYR